MTENNIMEMNLTPDIWRKAFTVIAEDDRKKTAFTLFVVVLGALSAALMVASILPFLTVLSNPNAVAENPALEWFADTLGLIEPYAVLIAVGVASIILIVLGSAIQIWKTYVMERYAAQQAFTIGQRLLRIYLGKPYAFFLDRHSSDMATIVLSEVGEAVGYFMRPAMELVAAGLTLLAITLLMLWVAPGLTLGVLVVVGGAFLLTSMVTRRYARHFGRIRAEANAERYRVVNEGFGGIKEIKVMGLEHRYQQRYDPPALKIVRALIGMRFISQMPRNVIHALVSVGVILLCLALVPSQNYASDTGLAGLVPTLGLFAMAAQRMLPELQKCYASLSQMQYGIAAVDRLFADFAGVEVPDLQNTDPPLPLNESFEMKGVGYTYPRATQPGLSDITLTIKAGETIGIVGSTGAGKTTLADVILGLLMPDQGEILVDGTALTADIVARWRKAVGYVPQDIFLTDASVAENIAFGLERHEIDQERLENAARIANLHDLITTELAEGYDTLLGERGVRLSGGQRQRVGIARAVYRDAELIVFDEATSALDTLTEKDIMAALSALPETKTIVLIAHRLSTIRACDRIIVMQDGQISDAGVWEDLLQKNPSFKALVTANQLDDRTAPASDVPTSDT